MLIRIFALTVCFSWYLTCIAQLPVGTTVLPLHSRMLTVDDGLSQGVVNSIQQDKKGFIWLATYTGLCRYDGREVKIFRHDKSDETSLAYNDIESLSPDSNNNIWITFSNNEVDVFNTVTGRARHISEEPAFSFLKNTSIYPGFLRWVGNNLCYFNKKTLTIFDPTKGSRHLIPIPDKEDILSIGSDFSGELWIATQASLYKMKENRINKICPLEGKELIHQEDWHLLNNSGIGIIMEDQYNHLIIPGICGFFIYDKGSRITNYIGRSYEPNFTPGIAKSPDNSIYFVLKDGLYRFDNDKDAVKIWAKDQLLHRGVSIYIDNSNVLWWGDEKGLGIRLIDLASPSFTTYAYDIGFNHDPLVPFLPFLASRKYLNDDAYLMRCVRDTSGTIWLRTANNYRSSSGERVQDIGLFRFDGRKTEKITFESDYTVYQIAFSPNNECWIVAVKSGKDMVLVKPDFLHRTFTRIINLKDKADGNVNYFLSASDTKVFYSDGKELQVFDIASKQSRYYSNKQLSNGSAILMAMPDKKDGDLVWIATYGSGIIKFNVVTGKLEDLTEKNGLPNNTVYYIAEDNKGYFWCSSNKGIFRFNPVNDSVISFTAKDGLQGNEFNRYHFLKTPDGHFIFGGTAGYTIFHPDSIIVDDYQTPAAITNIRVNNIDISNFPDWANRSVSGISSIKLSFDQNFLAFDFAGLQYNNPDKIRYRYRLKGFDPNWLESNNQASASYTNIPPGHYSFMVNVTNTSGAWSNRTETFAIDILPPWWRTWWAYGLYSLVLLSIVYAIYRNWLQRAQIKQEMIMKEREADYLKKLDEIKTRFFSNITHEFRTPLSLIIAPLQNLLENNKLPQPVTKTVLIAVRNAKQLQRLINQFLDLSKLESGTTQIHLSRGDVGVFIEDCLQTFVPYAESQNIEVTFNGENISEAYEFDADKLQTITTNLLSNALKFSGSGGKIEVKVISEPKDILTHKVTLSVMDRGIGIPEEKLPLLFDRFYQVDDSTTREHGGTGIGLALVKELTELLGGQIFVESKLGSGSVFYVSLPLKLALQNSVPPVLHVESTPPQLKDSQTEALSPIHTNSKTSPVILIVEDNEELKSFLVSVLEKEYSIVTAGNGEEGLSATLEHLPDIIISDIMMPKMDGFELCKRVKSNHLTDHIFFMMLTAKTTQESLIRGLRYKADDYIVKPFNMEEVALRIKNVISRKEKLKASLQEQLAIPEKIIAGPIVNENAFIKNLYEIIEQNVGDKKLTVDKLARQLALSERTLYRKLESELGLTPNEVIRQYRLKKAATLLSRGMSITDAAYSVGYETASWFSTSFKNFYNITPTDYINKVAGVKT